ncbi:hypothetical protein I4U23_008395 [Adineta vaga]|nr:hypothetical protein I4U23_008395 [Adineta vaga]
MLGLITCEDIEDFIKDINVSDYESRNMTRDDYMDLLRSPHCQPKAYPIPHGVKKWTTIIILILFLIFGLIGNALSATIMFRRSRRGLSAYFYLALLAIIDICVLYSSCLLYLLEIIFDYRPQEYSVFQCRLGFYIQHLFTYISAWFIVAVTFERFIVVRYPFQAMRICRMHVAYTIAIIIILFFSIYTAHCFFTMNLVHVTLQTDHGFHPNHTICDVQIYRPVLSFLDLCFYSVIPSICILIFNILIIITMLHAIKKRRDYLQANKSSPAMRSYSQMNKQRIELNLGNNKFIEQVNKQKPSSDPTSAAGIRLTCLLLIISFIFVICTLPISIRSLIAEYLPSQKSTARWQIIQLCLTLLMFLNHTINFVLYCLTGRTFRSECRKLICSFSFLKDVHISCTADHDSDKLQPCHHHPQQQQQQQQLIPIERNRLTPPVHHHHHQKQRANPRIKGIYV